jgi:hypothetical protein
MPIDVFYPDDVYRFTPLTMPTETDIIYGNTHSDHKMN